MSPTAASVRGAKEALKPAEVREAQAKVGVKAKDRGKHRTKAWVRQGEWFFVPADINPPANLILHNEPLQRGRAKPHTCEHLYRTGGETVYVSSLYPNGLGEKEYRKLIASDPKISRRTAWRVMRRDTGTMKVYAKGRVTHKDHATVVLVTWHRVMPNTESTFDRTVAFLD